MTGLRFLACVARGALEAQTVLLCESIRRFGGAHRGAPVTVYGPPVGADAALRELGVERRALGEHLPELPMANKVFACAAAEAEFGEDVLVFLDSDSLLVGEPAELELAGGHLAAVRPVNGNSAMSTGPGHAMDPFWLRTYDLCRVAPPPLVPAAVGGTPIRAFWNSGLVAVRRAAGLLGAWRQALLTLMRARHAPPGGKINQLEQVALAVALARAPGAVLVLDGRYNHPLPLRDRLGAPWRDARLEDLVHVHYFRRLHGPGGLDGLPEDDVVRWLAPRVPLEPMSHATTPRRVYRLPA